MCARDEGAVGGRQPKQADPRGGGDAGQCRRQHRAARSVAREQTRVWGDQAYRGQRAVIRQHAPRAQDFVNRRYRHRGVVDEIERAKNRTKSKVRAKVEHSIGVIKRVFGFAKCATAGLERTLIGCSWPARSPICSSRAAIYCAAIWRNLSGLATSGCRHRRCHTNNVTANLTLSRGAAIMRPNRAPPASEFCSAFDLTICLISAPTYRVGLGSYVSPPSPRLLRRHDRILDAAFF